MHIALSADVYEAVRSIRQLLPEAPVFLVGFSIGAYTMTKYVGEADSGVWPEGNYLHAHSYTYFHTRCIDWHCSACLLIVLSRISRIARCLWCIWIVMFACFWRLNLAATFHECRLYPLCKRETCSQPESLCLLSYFELLVFELLPEVSRFMGSLPMLLIASAIWVSFSGITFQRPLQLADGKVQGAVLIGSGYDYSAEVAKISRPSMLRIINFHYINCSW